MGQARGPVAGSEIDVRHVITDESTPQPGDNVVAVTRPCKFIVARPTSMGGDRRVIQSLSNGTRAESAPLQRFTFNALNLCEIDPRAGGHEG